MNLSLRLPMLGLFLLILPSAFLPTDAVNDLITRGREVLEAGHPGDAQKLFEQAAELDKGSLRTRTWVLRSWMDQGRINDSLDAIEEISKNRTKSAEIDYLYGMVFYQRAKGYVATNVTAEVVQTAFEEAVLRLEKAVKDDAELARDAFLPLAEAAWYTQKLDLARSAAETAVKRLPKSAESQFMLGRVALSQFSAAKDDAARKTAADADWDAAKNALSSAAEILGTPTDAAAIDLLARVRVQLGHTLVWRQRLEDAQNVYAAAMAGKLAVVDMGQVHAALGGGRFLAAVEAASRAITERKDANVPEVAALTWWLGWACFDQKQYQKADEAFSAAVQKEPKFVNAWFYIALSRYNVKDFEGALGALHRHWNENPSDLTAAVGLDAEANLKVLDSMVGWCAGKQRNEDAAFLSELQGGLRPDESRYWNNAGLFWRDAGESLLKNEDPEGKTLAPELFEKSWKAYTQALAIEPENPALLNDAAVILHYYLDRELSRAKEMYMKAIERARIELARQDLAPGLRELYEIALRDSTNNLARLEKGERRE